MKTTRILSVLISVFLIITSFPGIVLAETTQGGIMEVYDGNATSAFVSGERAKHLDSLRAVVKADAEKNRTMVFAVYGEDGTLIDTYSQDIPAGNEATTVSFNSLRNAEKVWKVKAFLWDGMNEIVPESNVVEIYGNTISWSEDWNLEGKASLNNETLVLNSGSGTTASAECVVPIADQYDISWDMEIEKFSGNEIVEISNGTNLIQLKMEEDGVSDLSLA